MIVDKVGSHVPYGHLIKTDVKPDSKVEKTAVVSSPIKSESLPEDKNSNDTQDTKGVIQLLQQGHFNGVADVRLRIVHSDKLLALEQQQLQTVATEKVDSLLATVGNVVDAFIDASQIQEQPIDEPTEQGSMPELSDAFTQFTLAVNTVKDEFLNGQSQTKESLVDNLNSTFQSFIELLSPQVDPLPEIQNENENPTAPHISTSDDEQQVDTAEEPTEKPPSVFQSFLENLEAAYAAAMDDLASSLDEVKTLPELSEPRKNGLAYEKFLDIYNEV
jgi:hypothetical protein